MQGIICAVVSENWFLSSNSDSFSWLYPTLQTLHMSVRSTSQPFPGIFWHTGALQSRACSFYHPPMLSPRNWRLRALFCRVHTSSLFIESASKWSERGWEHGLETELPSLLAVGYLSIMDQLVLPPHVMLPSLLLLKGEDGNKFSTSPLLCCLKIGLKPAGEQAQVFPHPSLIWNTTLMASGKAVSVQVGADITQFCKWWGEHSALESSPQTDKCNMVSSS